MTILITDIQPLEDDPNYRVIFVNDVPEITIPTSTVEQLGITTQQCWTEELSKRVQSFEDIEKARTMALKLISMKAWGVKELATRLVKRGIHQEIATTTTEQLCDDGWLDDHAYACARIRDWVRCEPASRVWLRNKLQQRQLSEESISTAIEEETGNRSEQDAATELALTRIAKATSLDETTLRRRVISALGRRGFPSDVGSEAFRRARAENV
jgi:SOS response regulatory protein OraA/RecX